MDKEELEKEIDYIKWSIEFHKELIKEYENRLEFARAYKKTLTN